MCILVVEDDFLIRLILVEELVEAGYDVKEAATGDDAIDILLEIDQHLRVLVTDIHMPGERNGIEVARHVHERSPTVPVIFTTGRPDVLAGVFKPEHNHHLIRKPYVPSEVVTKVHKLLAA